MTKEELEGQDYQNHPLGRIVDGSLSRGVEVRLDPGVSVEDIKEGIYAIVQGEKFWFFGIVTDVALNSADPELKQIPPDVSDPFIASVISGTVTYGSVSVLPMLTMPPVLGDDDVPKAAKTIPAHFSRVYRASERDVEMVFGKEDKKHFWIGNPLDMETKVCLNLEELVQRSSGIFGKSGTGKTFLTRLLLAGVLQSDAASSLIFDMHSEYGWMGQDTDRGRSVKGLKQLFTSKVSVFSLDPENAIRRKVPCDFEVQVGYDEIGPEDVELLKDTLSLSDVAASAAYNLEQHMGQKAWLQNFLALKGRDEVYELANSINVQPNALAALYNRLSRLKRFGFLVPQAADDSVKRILEHLDRGMHVVLEFGRYGNDLTAYILVANLLTRRIHQRYVHRKEEAQGGAGKDPRPLIICIEEAHRFLNPAVASQTIFGTIARELRKYNVTLMVIDQRPSAIDSEVMSQIGTKVTCQLDNEKDIDATLAGVPGSRELRSVLSRLDSKQQALIFGHAVPLPVVVRTREYGAGDSYTDLVRPKWQSPKGGGTDRSLEEELNDLF